MTNRAARIGGNPSPRGPLAPSPAALSPPQGTDPTTAQPEPLAAGDTAMPHRGEENGTLPGRRS